MGRKKKEQGTKVISVRVSNEELATIREVMQITRKSASHVMRDAFRQFIAPTS